MLTQPARPAVDLPALLTEGNRRTAAVSDGVPAGSLAVVDARLPDGVGPEQASAIHELVAEVSQSAGALASFDPGPGRYVLLFPLTRAWITAEVLQALARRLSRVEVAAGWGRHVLRPSVGVSVVPLAGGAALEVALTEAVDLARASRVERGLQVHIGGAATTRFRMPRLRRHYGALSARRKAWALTVANVAAAWLVPFLVCAGLWLAWGVDVTRAGFWVVFGSVLLTAATVYAEALLALPASAPPEGELASYPPASAVVVAYLPNEAANIVDTVRCLLAQDYPGRLQVVLAYNTPEPLPVEHLLADLAAVEPRLLLLRVGDSTSKAQNINAALQVVNGAFVGVFDSDHRPMPGAFRQAARWIAAGADGVQGRNVVRNGRANWLARMVAVEFEGIYAVAHPGRAALHGFGIFGGSNGFWRTDVLDRLRMRPDMLTEDIDISIRAVVDGARIVVDRRLISEELAPLTPMALWSQRMRWSQGWYQVSRRQLGRTWRSPALSRRQRIGACFLLGWREMYPWISALMVPILAFSLLVRHDVHFHWLLPFFVAATVYVSGVGPIQALFAWRLAVPEMRRRRSWWWQYLLVTGALFGEFKAHVNRAAHLRELIGDRAWQVTPRTAGRPVAATADRTDPRPTTVVSMGAVLGSVATVDLDVPMTAPAADGPAEHRLRLVPPAAG